MADELGNLIQDTRAANGWSFAQVAAQAQAQGHDLKRTNLHRLTREPLRRVVPETIRAVAAGLRLPEGVVWRAALASLGIDTGQAPAASPEDVVMADTRFTVEQKRAILAVMGAMRAPATLEAVDHPAGEQRKSRGA